MENDELRKKIREVYYDWANMPEFERIEKYPDDKRVEDSFMRIFHQEQTKLIEQLERKLSIMEEVDIIKLWKNGNLLRTIADSMK